MPLYASTQDLDLLGLPAAATATVAASRMPMLQAASLEADSYLRARYSLPLIPTVETVEPSPASGSTGTGQIVASVPSGVTLTRAWGVRLEVLTTGVSGVATGRVSIDGGVTWQPTVTLSNGALTVTLSGSESLTLTLSDPGGAGWFDGDLFYIPVRFGALTHNVVAVAVWKLLGRRGADPDSVAYDRTKTEFKEAIKWLEGVRDNKYDPGLTDSSSANEGGFLYYPETEFEGDRRWDGTLGRVARSQPTARTAYDDGW
jgi:phage gp36-like protein